MMNLTLIFIMLLGILMPAVSSGSGHGPDGQDLFEAHCVACHRSGGQGSIGLPLSKSKFSALSDAYLFKTIRHGRPGRVMPAFDTLSDAQVKAIVEYLRQWSGTSSFQDPEIAIQGDAKEGKVLFAGYCANCHGEEGKGLGKGTGQSYSRERDFTVVPPAIGNVGFLNSASDHLLREVTLNGRQGTIMPAFGKLGLSQQDIDDIIVYLREIQQQHQKASDKHQAIMPGPTIVFDSPNDFETTLEDLKQALTGYNFRIFPDRYLEMGMYPEWEVNKKHVTVRYCNFNRLYDMLKIDPRVGIGLPCRITVAEHDDGRVQLVAMNMALIARMFNNDQLRDYAQELSSMQYQILEEVTF